MKGESAMACAISFAIGFIFGGVMYGLLISSKVLDKDYNIDERKNKMGSPCRENKCPICHRIFYSYGDDWVYKIKTKTGTKNVCSYHCSKGKKCKEEYDKMWATKDGSHI